MDKNCEKIHYIAPNIYCCGAGTAADTENTTGKLPGSARSRLKTKNSGCSFNFFPAGTPSSGKCMRNRWLSSLSCDITFLIQNTNTESRVVTAMTLLKQMLFRYQGHISAALVLGGVDATGPHLYTVYPHGRWIMDLRCQEQWHWPLGFCSTDKLPYVTMGSGSLAAMATFEQGYKDDMTVWSSYVLFVYYD